MRQLRRRESKTSNTADCPQLSLIIFSPSQKQVNAMQLQTEKSCLFPPSQCTPASQSSHHPSDIATTMQPSEPTSNMYRITFLQFAIYDSTSHILTAARKIYTNARDDPFIFLVIFPYLTIATFFLSILCPKPNLQKSTISTMLITILYHTTGALIPLFETWALKHQSSAPDPNHSPAAEIRWSRTQIQVTHFALSWLLTSEVNYWRTWLLAQPPEPRPKHPDSFLPITIRSSAAWYTRTYPTSRRVSEVNLAVPRPGGLTGTTSPSQPHYKPFLSARSERLSGACDT